MSLSTSNKKSVKKTTFLSDRLYVEQAPNQDDIACLTDKEGNVLARYIPIEVVERDLDRWAWSTQNFTYQQYQDKFRNHCISASLELVIPWKDEDGNITVRKLAGGCNFVIGTYAPNSHFVATAKSECVKNAASDLGKKFGRGLNEGLHLPVNNPEPQDPVQGKMKPDKSILAQFKKAVSEGDENHQKILLNIYEIKPEEYAKDGN